MTDDMERYYYWEDGNWEQISDESTTNNFYTLEQCANELNRLNDENESLRTKNNAYIQDIEVFKEENTHLKLENEQLKSSDTITDLETEIMKLKTIIDQLRTDNTKQKKKLNTAMKENEHIKQTIKDMIESERTEIGKMTLRQLWRQIQ